MSNQFRLSVSKLKTYTQCPLKYKFTYIDKLPRKTFEFHTFGKFCHKVLEDFHNVYIQGSDLKYNVVMSKAFRDAQSGEGIIRGRANEDGEVNA